jgi:DNA-binding response OmpR family regulator
MEGRILLVERDPTVRLWVQRLLEARHHHVETVSSFPDAPPGGAAEPWDLVLADLELLGRDVPGAIRSFRDGWGNTGLVLLAEPSSVGEVVDVMKWGATDCIQRPFSGESFAEIVEKAVDRVRRIRSERKRWKGFQTAYASMRASRDLDEVLRLIVGSVTRLVRAKGSAVLLLSRDGSAWELKASTGLSQIYLAKGPVRSASSLAETLEGRTTWIPDVSADPRVQYPEEARKEGIRSILSVPMNVRGRVIGCLRVYCGEDRSFSEADMGLLQRFAEQAAIAVERAISFQAVERDIRSLRSGLPRHLQNHAH